MSQKQYILFAGVNGAGKSTLYKNKVIPKTETMARINSDEIIVNSGKDWRDAKAQFESGIVAVKLIDENFKNGISFNQETTLTGNSILKNIRRAKALGYEVIMHYVGLESADLAVKRVEHRVSKGGHGISETDIRRRYENSLNNLYKVIPLCDKVIVYDNTNEFFQIAAFEQGKELLRADKNSNIKWLENAFNKQKQLDNVLSIPPRNPQITMKIISKNDLSKINDMIKAGLIKTVPHNEVDKLVIAFNTKNKPLIESALKTDLTSNNSSSNTPKI